MAMLCCVAATVGYPGACVLSVFRDGVARILRDVRGLVSGVLHSSGNGGTGALSAPFNTETLLGTV
ncbi:hypothetical protein Bpse01_03080 [Bifidobacterium pseudocatenulatum]|jgi:hypothetical protein|nr:hypothetical protein DN0207_15650 [Bifidobacterium pseudocatenulatum]GLZ82439.1 hypothetical protein Bpse01_03080 [Bifidobacterium pseudocatenulatum]